MLHTDTRLKMTDAEWRTLSAMGLEHESVLKRRLHTVAGLRRWLNSLLDNLQDVPEEVVLLRTVFVPWYLERLGATALRQEADGSGVDQ